MRFGLIGVGTVGRIRGTALAALPGCTLSAVHDLNMAVAKELAGGAHVFDSAESLFASDACDAVIISTPPNSHERLAIGALENDKHVIVGKSLAIPWRVASGCLKPRGVRDWC